MQVYTELEAQCSLGLRAPSKSFSTSLHFSMEQSVHIVVGSTKNFQASSLWFYAYF
jgi:hypothetical protein